MQIPNRKLFKCRVWKRRHQHILDKVIFRSIRQKGVGNMMEDVYDTRIHHHTIYGVIPMKHYTIRCPYCGATTTKWEWLLKLLLIFTNTYHHNCSVCHHKSTWLYLFHLRHDSTNKTEQIFNKGKLFDDRI